MRRRSAVRSLLTHSLAGRVHRCGMAVRSADGCAGSLVRVGGFLVFVYPDGGTDGGRVGSGVA